MKFKFVSLLTAILVFTNADAAEVTAYKVSSGVKGDQDLSGFPQSLGMDFDVNNSIYVNSLGVFDSGQNGIRSSMFALIFDRVSKRAVAWLEFTSVDAGLLDGGSRFKSLAEPLLLQEGFKGTIVATYNNGAAEPNGNKGNNNSGWSVDSGDGAISFVGGGRISYGTDSFAYPTVLDGGPADRYAAGTFKFTVVPEPSVVAFISAAMLIALGFQKPQSKK